MAKASGLEAESREPLLVTKKNQISRYSNEINEYTIVDLSDVSATTTNAACAEADRRLAIARDIAGSVNLRDGICSTHSQVSAALYLMALPSGAVCSLADVAGAIGLSTFAARHALCALEARGHVKLIACVVDFKSFTPNKSNSSPRTKQTIHPTVEEAIHRKAPREDISSRKNSRSQKGTYISKKSPAYEHIFSETDFAQKLAYLWNEICWKNGCRRQGALERPLVRKIAERYHSAQQLPHGVTLRLTTLDDWGKFFAWICRSKFLTGKVPPRDKLSTPFQISFYWLFDSEENFFKVRDGAYHNTLNAPVEWSMPTFNRESLLAFGPHKIQAHPVNALASLH